MSPDETREHENAEPEQQANAESRPRIVVVGPDGTEVPVEPKEDAEDPHSLVDQPAKVMRIGTMIKQLLDEVRQADLDPASRERLREIYETSVNELAAALSPDLQGELKRLAHPFETAGPPSEAELQVAKAQLVGWLEGLSGQQILSSDIYFVSSLPSDLQWLDVGLICGAALFLSFLATLYPAWRAARTQPAEALRYE